MKKIKAFAEFIFEAEIDYLYKRKKELDELIRNSEGDDRQNLIRKAMIIDDKINVLVNT